MLSAAIECALKNVCAGRLRYLAPSGGPPGEPYLGPSPVKGYPLHSHNFAELVQAVDGRALMNLGRRTIRVDNRTAWLILPGMVHYETFERSQESYHLLWLVFSPAGSNLFISKYGPQKGFGTLPERLVGVTTNQARLWELTTTPGVDGQPLGRAEIQGLLIQTLVASLSHMEKATCPANHRHVLVEQVRGYLEHHLCDRIALADLAQMARCTPNYLNGIFRKQTGQPIHQFVLHRRLDVGRKLLAEGTRSVKAVAYELGFRDPLYFSRLFRKRFGVSPTDYRRR